ncbi:isoleucine--tRNA ligase [Candidatus Woesearchaeota archaeon]|nr:isoleucine--tRNA ligase [Candidatus Woesearchaeota archaeon]
MQYDFKLIEPDILKFWKDNQIYEKLVARNKGKKTFYYLDGPPYTTGKIHIGHAWGRALRDMVLRYKRMNGFDVWDQPGFDMHGLPIEVSVEKELGIKDKKEIVNKIGLQKFIQACEKYALDNLWPMIEDFKRLGVWMNWNNPYMTIKNEYIEGAWWALAKAHEKKLLYLGKKSMTWCPRCATALAKHELEYANRKDPSIFVKLSVGKNEYLIIWTTTPWTLPYNMAVMAHPDFNYVKCQVEDETWILAEALAPAVIGAVAGKKYTVTQKVKGEALKGTKYTQPFKEEVPFHQKNKETHAYTVILSDKYVTLDAGSGLVHCAPGCGPEDFEVGKEHGITPFNEADEHGCFPESMGPLAGLVAKQDDHKFIELLETKGLLLGQSTIEHEYAGCWRCKTPVIFRATDQWFLAVEKLKQDMAEKNKKVHWTPDWAGNRQFDSWLKSLQDWCISRQRFWGIPLPIWTCTCGQHKVLASRQEIEKSTGKKLDNLHRPWIDQITLTCTCGKTMTRVPDVLDVWLDSGVAPWATLGYPEKQEQFKKLGGPDLILEGKDQIRGWFNSLTCMAFISHGQMPFKACYMHGFINDSQGRKMSKSLKNFITPYEIIDVYGADTLRYYQVGGAQPGVDLNFNHEDAKTKHRNLLVLWNIHNYLLDLSKELNRDPTKLDAVVMKTQFGIEEKYIFSKLHSTIKTVTQLYEEYRLNEIPAVLEELYLALSRSYIQMVRDKAALGDDVERQVVLYTVYTVLTESLKMLSTIAPFITEQIWHNLTFKQPEESIHHCTWPKADEKMIDKKLEMQLTLADDVIQAILAAREKAKLTLRWPIKVVQIVTHDQELLKTLEELEDIIKTQTNTKEVHGHEELAEIKTTLKPNPGPLGKTFGAKSLAIMKAINALKPSEVLSQLTKNNTFTVKLDKETLELNQDHIILERTAPKHYVSMEFRNGIVYLDTTRTPELDAEGLAREIMRRVQQMRKDAGLVKTDSILLYAQTDSETAKQLAPWKEKIQEKCGAKTAHMDNKDPVKKHQHTAEETIKGKVVKLFMDKAY